MQKGAPGSSLTCPSPKLKVRGLHPVSETCQEGVCPQGQVTAHGSVRQREQPSHGSWLICPMSSH